MSIAAASWANRAAVRRVVTDLAAEMVQSLALPLDAVAGAETAGIPFAAWLADRLTLPLRYVRKRPLGVGRNAQVEGGSVEGLRVLLMDDLTTDGSSKVAFVRGLRSAGGVVEDALTIFYHGVFPGTDERLQAAGLRLHALATWDDLLGEASAANLAPEDRAEIQAFLADPVEWSMLHGGRAVRPPRKV